MAWLIQDVLGVLVLVLLAIYEARSRRRNQQMSYDFSNIQKMKPSAGKVIEYELFQLEGRPTLLLRSAGEDNPAYFNAILKRNKTSARRLRSAGVTRELLAKNRAEDRELYSKHVVKGWRGVLDANGTEVPFSQEACHAFLEALPDFILDDIRNFASEPSNFSDDPLPDEDDLEADVGNSGNSFAGS